MNKRQRKKRADRIARVGESILRRFENIPPVSPAVRLEMAHKLLDFVDPQLLSDKLREMILQNIEAAGVQTIRVSDEQTS